MCVDVDVDVFKEMFYVGWSVTCREDVKRLWFSEAVVAISLRYLFIFFLTLPYLAVPHHPIFYLTFSSFTFTCHNLPYLTLPYHVPCTLPWHILSNFTLYVLSYLSISYLTLPYLIFSYLTRDLFILYRRLSMPCRLTSPCLALPCHVLPYLAMSCLTSPCLALPCHVLPHLTLPYLALPFGYLPCHTLSPLILLYLAISCLTFSPFILLYHNLPSPYHALPNLVISYLILPYLTLLIIAG